MRLLFPTISTQIFFLINFSIAFQIPARRHGIARKKKRKLYKNPLYYQDNQEKISRDEIIFTKIDTIPSNMIKNTTIFFVILRRSN